MKVKFWDGHVDTWQKVAEGDMRQMLVRLIGPEGAREITADPKWQEDQYHFYSVAGILIRVKGKTDDNGTVGQRIIYELVDFYRQTGNE